MRFKNDQVSTAYSEYLDALDYDEDLIEPEREEERLAAPPDGYGADD